MNSSIIQSTGVPGYLPCARALVPHLPKEGRYGAPSRSQTEQLAQPPCLGAAHRDLGLLAVIHADLVAALEPGHHFLDAIDVDQERAVRAPEEVEVEGAHQLFHGAAVAVALHALRHHGDDAVFDGGKADVFLIDE